MAVKLVGNYAKRLGLPGYSSHQFSVSVETELTDLGQVQGEATRIYQLLQDAVDREIQQTGFVPDDNYGRNPQQPATTPQNHGYSRVPGNGNGNGNGGQDQWACSDKQRELILKLVTQNGLDRQVVDNTAMARFNKGVRNLNKLEMSGLIQELLETCNASNGSRRNGGGNGPMNQTTLFPPPAAPAREAAPPKKDPLEYISASRLKCWQDCRLKWFFRYVEQIPTITSPALLVGQVVHRVLQAWNIARWRGTDSSPDHMKQVFEASWVDGCEEEAMVWEKPDQEAKEKTKAWSILDHYLKHTPVPQEEKPQAVEVRVERDLIGHGLPPLVGIIDLVRQGGRIVDFKTTARTPDPALVEHQNATQLGCYALLYREATGQTESGFEIHSLVKTKQPKLVVTSMDPMTADQVRGLVRIMESYVRGVESEDFIPSPGLQCSYCDYFAECRAWKGGDGSSC